MKKKVFIGIALCALVTIVSLNFNSIIRKSGNTSVLTLANVEALAYAEGDISEFWCCGNTGTCAKGPNFIIYGTLKTTACE